MTFSLEQHIAELQAEWTNCADRDERRQIGFEIEMAEAELAILIAEQEGDIDAEPPF